MAGITVYGIKSCDSCRNACKWLSEHHVEYQFHDLRKDGLDEKQLSAWLGTVGWETLLNRRSTTWRELPQSEREPIDAQRAQSLMLANPTLIKRPVLEHSTNITVGFSPARYEIAIAGAQ